MKPKIEHDTRAAIEFLKKWSPEGPWVLTAIVPDGKIETTTFRPAAWVDAAQWIEERQGVANLYFHVNPVRRALNSKASKEDVAALAWLHVDIDPRAGEDIAEEQDRALRLLRNHSPKPTVIVFSGGGYQGFWKLAPDDRLVIDGNVTKAQELEAYNVQLEKVFQADHCFNCDRIMRLVGTVNLPNAKKRKQGRVPALATLVEWDDAAVYSIDQFTPAAKATATPPRAARKQRVSAPVAGGTGVGVDELTAWARENGKTIKESTLALIATGTDPIDPTKYTSRSEALFRVCCDLVRAEVSDDMIFGVITGPNEIAASVKDKPDWKGYALRQIERAHENAVDPWLLKLNDQHAVITSGKVRIAGWRRTHPELDREALDLQSFDDFRNRYRNQKVVVGFAENGQPIQKAVGSWWIDHPQRREFDNVIFIPGKAEEINGFLNLWRGWGVAPAPGGDWSLMREHIHFLCGGSDYGLKWLADAVQRPDRPAGVALILRGKEGTGKGVFGRAAKELFGRHGLQVTNAKHVTGNFNLHLRDCCLLFADEVTTHGDKTAEAVMKTLITEDTLVIEGKGADVVTAPNYAHIIMASNERWIVPAGANARRFAIFDVPDDHMEDYTYFAAIEKQLYAKSPNGTLIPGAGLAAMLYDLMNMDLGDWRPSHNLPKNMALSEQKARSLPGLSAYVFDMLLTGNLPPNTEESGGVPWVATSDLRAAADNWLKPRKGDNHFADNDIQILLAKRLKARKKRRGGRNGYFLDLQRMRAEWDTCPDLFTWGEWPDDSEDDPDPKPPF